MGSVAGLLDELAAAVGDVADVVVGLVDDGMCAKKKNFSQLANNL